MKNLLIMLLLACTLSIAGCGFLNPVQKKDSAGNPMVDISGTIADQYAYAKQ